MDTEIARQLEAAHLAITLLVAGLLVAIGYIVSQPLPPEMDTASRCPLHRCLPEKCPKGSHD